MAGNEIVPRGHRPALTLQEYLTAQFVAWERPGRGWPVFPYPVEIEPPFEPFYFYAPPTSGIDDGHRDTWASALVGRLKGKRPQTDADPEPALPMPPPPEPSFDSGERVEFVLAPPQEWRSPKDVGERLFASLEHCEYPVSFEVVGNAKSIAVQFTAYEGDAAIVRAQLRAHCPDVAIDERDSGLHGLLGTTQDRAAVAVDFGLSEEFMRPLRPVRSFDPDTLVTVVGALEDLGPGEAGILQVLFQAVRHPWTESIARAVTGPDGKSFFADAPELLKLAEEKTASRLYAAVIRVGACAPGADRAWDIARHVGALFAQFGQPSSNRFIPLTNDDYPDDEHWENFAARRSHRTGMLLNLDELVSLVHVPSASVRSAKLIRYTRKTKAAPEAATRVGIMLGENIHHGSRQEVRIGPAERMRHTYMIGASGTGKSSLLLNMMTQDIEAGAGVGLLDPHGDLADELLARIPETRLKDVILFDPSDEERPVAWNILQAHTPLEKTLLSSDITATFKRLSTSWGDQMTSVLGNAVLAMLESDRGGSIGDLRRFLVDADWRKEFLSSVTDPEIVFYWQKEFPLLAGRPQASILTRLDTFLRPRPVRAMVTARRDRLDFRAVLDERKIFIAKLAQGAIGEENSSLLGSLLVSKFHQVALSRQDVGIAERAHFYLYIDEFHHFITPTLASLLSGARKYRLGLTLAHQDLRQLVSRDAEVAAAAIANPCTRICFRVGEADARMLKESFSYFDGKDLQNLGVGEAIVRVERSDWDFNLKTFLVPPVDAETAQRRREEALRLSRAAYGRVQEADPPPAVHPPSQAASRTPADHAAAVAAAPAPPPRDAPSSETRAFIAYVAQHPGAFVTHAYKALGLSGYKGDKLKEALVRDGMVLQSETRQGEGGRVAKVLTLTEAGVRFVAEGAPAGPGKGGSEHTGLQRRIKDEAVALGWKAVIEKRLEGGGQVDVALEKEAMAVAIEISITTDADHEVGNIRKCLTSGFDWVVGVSDDPKFLEVLKTKGLKAFSLDERKRVRYASPDKVRAVLLAVAGKGVDSEEKRVNSAVRNQNALLDVEEAAAMLGLSPATLYSWVSQRKIPYVKVGRLTKFHRERLQEWLENSSKEPKPERFR